MTLALFFCIFCGEELDAAPGGGKEVGNIFVLHIGPMHADPCYTTFQKQRAANEVQKEEGKHERDEGLHLVAWEKTTR